MKSTMDNFINIKSEVEEIVENSNKQESKEWLDPLRGVGDEVHIPKQYRVDSIVFAEPFTSTRGEENSFKTGDRFNEENDKIILIENVIVQKRCGKKNSKYIFDIGDTANPTCPQPNCNRTFSTTTLLRAHIRKVHCMDRSRFICESCGTGFPTEYRLRRHSAVHEKRRVECPVCRKMLSARTNLALHLRSHSESRQHTCDLCRRSFVRRATLMVHVKFVHREGALSCDKCGDGFESRSQLSRHTASRGCRQ